ncbi:MAG TPA: RDD family protein [Planctomycetaceae bacterium]|nr:RDD family protein [Planctomycetaceae bacterium]
MNETQNPYAAPPEHHDPVPQSIVHASQGARFLNFLIDYFAQIGIGFVFMAAAILIGGQPAADFIDNIPSVLIGIPVLLCYYFVFEATTSRTLGKLVTGTKVVNEDGDKATIGQIAGRTFARLIPFEALTFIGAPPRGLHDSLPKTFVIKIR